MAEFTKVGLEVLRLYAKTLDDEMEELMKRKDGLDSQIDELDDFILRYAIGVRVYEQGLGGK